MRLIFGALTACLVPLAWGDGLEEAFLQPSPEARPHVWYHLMNGNVTKAGITRDFEELAKAGIGGVQMFDAGCSIPPGDVSFNSEAWFDLLHHAASEARRLGLEICLPNCSGWSSSGGPWNPPSNGMKRVTFSETRMSGPSKFRGILPREREDHGFYEDIAVLAYPLPAVETQAHRLPTPRVESGIALPENAAALLTDGRTDGTVGFDRKTGNAEAITLTYPEPVEASGVAFQIAGGDYWRETVDLVVELSEDGKTFLPALSRHVVLADSGDVDTSVRTFAFDRRRRFRSLRAKFTFGKWGRYHDFRLGELCPVSMRRIPDVRAKTFAVRSSIREETVPATPDQVVPQSAVRDVARYKAAAGTVEMGGPPGEWAVLGVGCVCTGRCNHPASEKGRGLEVDKLSAAAMDYHFEQYVARLCRRLGPLAGNVASGLNNILVDSYEVGSQNWTQGFDRLFAERCGYDLMSFLPVFAGMVVDGVETSERFLEDFRRTVADLFAENYSGALARKCHAYGLRCSIEPYGCCPADDLQYGEHADIPMGEFWSNAGNPYDVSVGNVKYVSHVAHVWGKRFCGAEAFTASPSATTGRWLTTPFSIKAQGDRAYASGVNRIIYHRFVHQPWADDRYLPGMTMGRWGMHLDRTQTWWPLAGVWFGYQTRCQSLLQRGTFVADALFVASEAAPSRDITTVSARGTEDDPLADYDYDICPADALPALKVEKGSVVVPGGVRYRVLSLPTVGAMSPEALRCIAALQREGATVVWRKRPTRAPGLRWGASGDADVRCLADGIFSAGALACPTAEALRRLGVEPDVKVESDGVSDVAWIHRRDAEADWYFVALPNAQSTSVELSFRTAGRQPELWDAETGTIADAAVWRMADGRTRVTVPFSVCGSKFVVFRRPADGSRTKETVEQPSPVPIDGPWDVRFPHGFAPNRLAGAAPEEMVRFEKLTDWAVSPVEGVRYFSGTATYRRTIEVPKPVRNGRFVLDLGTVKHFAEVRVNRRDYAPLWKPPFRVDITDALAKADGKAELEVKVTNLWPNRLIGDDRQFAPDCEWQGGVVRGTKEIGIKELPQWVKEGKKSPTGRLTFTTWKHWDKDDALRQSGLIGPVCIRTFVTAD